MLQYNYWIGVTPGSILRPLLFLLCINDLHNAVSSASRLFVDNACLFLSSNELFSLDTYMNHDLDKFRIRAIAKTLTVNPNKPNDVITVFPPM